jgi:hypothetical protein
LQQRALSLPACTSITTFLNATRGTTFAALEFYGTDFPGGFTHAAAILATIVSAIAVLVLNFKRGTN